MYVNENEVNNQRRKNIHICFPNSEFNENKGKIIFFFNIKWSKFDIDWYKTGSRPQLKWGRDLEIY